MLACATDAAEPTTYTARYTVEYKGKRVGTSEFSVSRDPAQGLYRFTSNVRTKGLLKLISPRPVVERSNFVYEQGRIQPVEFWYEDGTRKGEDNVHVLFDWERRVATATGEGGSTEVALESGVLDRGSMQVAMMGDLASGNTPGPYVLIDGGTLRTYEYTGNGNAMLDTPIGQLQTRRVIQQRAGSSRRTIIWAAPKLRYLPVRMEQQRDGETRTVFTLESVEGL